MKLKKHGLSDFFRKRKNRLYPPPRPKLVWQSMKSGSNIKLHISDGRGMVELTYVKVYIQG